MFPLLFHMDAAMDALVQHVLVRFGFHHDVMGLHVNASVDAVRNELGVIADLMMARSVMPGIILGTHIGNAFRYRAELYLIGLHDHLIRGISLGFDHHHQEVSTAGVAVFQLHNFFHLEEVWVVYGGEGDHLAKKMSPFCPTILYIISPLLMKIFCSHLSTLVISPLPSSCLNECFPLSIQK
jgi:hypothetical protein